MKTSTKIQFAEILLKIFTLIIPRFRNNPRIYIKRKNIHWQLDINEGIDLSILLFGGFELDSMRIYKNISKLGDITFFDIGANIGSHSLLMASILSNQSKIHSFEPTDFAYKKFLNNLSLNKEISKKILLNQTFLSNTTDGMPSEIYSSWKLLDKNVEKHRHHHGLKKSTKGADTISIDNYCNNHQITKVHFMKLDVDGFEIDVLKGAKGLFKVDKPIVLFEYAPYVHDEMGNNPLDILNFFYNHMYKIFYAKNLKEIDSSNINIKKGESINLIAIHPNNTLNFLC